MREIRTTADIHAAPQRVWEVLGDLNAYKGWHPYITRAEGGVGVGGTLTLRLELPGGEALTVQPVVLEAEEPRELRWLWANGFSGICDTEQCFVLVPKGDRLHGERL